MNSFRFVLLLVLGLLLSSAAGAGTMIYTSDNVDPEAPLVTAGLDQQDAQAIRLFFDLAGFELNPVMIEKMLSIITEQPGKEKSVILIEHNIDAVIRICNRLIFMDEGKTISEGTPEEVRSDSRVIEAYIE